ncbi:MAG: peptidoglycan DD-metalloendopeptidase family protein [Betaproteobacteria bacterium]|nr:peptidoglycan DD-metalloendopeptidase family protein [Betaproteobacteria bacterium]
MTALVTACGSTPTAAPVIERSPNAGTAAKTAPAASSATAAASKPQTSAPPNPAPTNPPATVAPAVSTAKSEKLPLPVPEKLPAPMEEPTTKPYREGDWRPEYHIVKKGDTLYSIALDYGQDYRELAAWNNLEDPGLIKIDQRLRLFPRDSVGEATTAQPMPLPAPVAAPVFSEPKARKLPYSEQALAQLKMPASRAAATPTPSVPATTQPSAKSPTTHATTAPLPAPAQKETPSGDGKMIWEWPAQGRLLYAFGQGANQKGVGIEGRSGQPVLAAAPGKVVYSGSGLRGYGKLIIIKHNESYLSVYAHNSQILVKEGQTVAKGQKIAEIGDTDSDRVALHFEIRRLGKPIDPLQYLPERIS